MLVEKIDRGLYYSWDGKVWIFERVAYKKEFLERLSQELENDEKIYLYGNFATFMKDFGDKAIYIEYTSDLRLACRRDDDCAKQFVESLRKIAETLYNDKKDNEEKKITFKIQDLLD